MLSLSAFYQPHIDQRRKDPDYAFVVDLIARAEARYGMPVRADATCFLAGTMMDMIVKPMRNLHDDAFDDAFRDILFEDISAVIEKSVAVSKARQRSVITSTTAIMALGDVVEDLIVSSQTTMGEAKGEAKV